jgi:hypothetical protein
VKLIGHQYLIGIPVLPAAEISPNARVHWTKRQRAVRLYRQAVYLAAVDFRNTLERQQSVRVEPIGRARLDFRFVFDLQRVRDPDNCIAMAKPAIDALVHAGLLAGDSAEQVTIGAVHLDVDPKLAPLTEISIAEVGE